MVTRRYSELSDRDEARPGLRPLANRASLGDEIYETLLAQLISLKIPPGDRLSVDALVRDLGVSQTPIRSALIRLEAEGLVVKKHNSGYSAAPMPSGERFRETYELRLLLEPAAAEGAASRVKAGWLKKLTATTAEMEATVAEDNHATYSKFAILDARFHEIIAEHCGNSLISDILGRLYAHMNLFRLRHHFTVTSEAVTEHQLIMDAIKAEDPLAASNAMRNHIQNSKARMEPVYLRLT